MALIEINWTPSTRELRQFAMIWFPASLAVGGGAVLHFTDSLPVAVAIWCLAPVALLLGYFVPKAIRPIFVGLMCVTFPIGWVVSHAMFLCVFYLVVTPIGIVMRLGGRDALDRKFDRSADTYWCSYRQCTDPARYLRQF